MTSLRSRGSEKLCARLDRNASEVTKVLRNEEQNSRSSIEVLEESIAVVAEKAAHPTGGVVMVDHQRRYLSVSHQSFWLTTKGAEGGLFCQQRLVVSKRNAVPVLKVCITTAGVGPRRVLWHPNHVIGAFPPAAVFTKILSTISHAGSIRTVAVNHNIAIVAQSLRVGVAKRIFDGLAALAQFIAQRLRQGCFPLVSLPAPLPLIPLPAKTPKKVLAGEGDWGNRNRPQRIALDTDWDWEFGIFRTLSRWLVRGVPLTLPRRAGEAR